MSRQHHLDRLWQDRARHHRRETRPFRLGAPAAAPATPPPAPPPPDETVRAPQTAEWRLPLGAAALLLVAGGAAALRVRSRETGDDIDWEP